MTYIVQILVFLILTTIFIIATNEHFTTYEKTKKYVESLEKDSTYPFYNEDIETFNYKKSILKNNVYYFKKF